MYAVGTERKVGNKENGGTLLAPDHGTFNSTSFRGSFRGAGQSVACIIATNASPPDSYQFPLTNGCAAAGTLSSEDLCIRRSFDLDPG